MGPTIAPLADDDGYVSPDFDVPSESENDFSEDVRPPSKKQRTSQLKTSQTRVAPPTGEDDLEALALQMLRHRR